MAAKRDPSPHEMTDVDYAALAEFRYQLRLFVRSSEDAAREAGLEPQQHQLLLAIRGAAPGVPVTIGFLSERLQLRHNSLVGLIDRLEQRGLVRRKRSRDDLRVVEVALTAGGKRVLERLSRHHIELLQTTRALSQALLRLVGDDARG